MDRLGAMSVFVAVVEAGSLSAAGRKLKMPLPTVSRRISDLESHLGGPLLMRSTTHLALTDAGRSYLAACKSILAQVDEAERLAAGEYTTPTGELILAAPIVFGRLLIVPLVAEFLDKYPDVTVQLVLEDRPLDLLDNHIDVAVRLGTLPDSNLVASRIGEIHHVCCAGPRYLKARGTPKSPRDLLKHDCINFTFAALTSPEEWKFREEHAATSMPIRSRLIVNTAEAAIEAAIVGVGITRLLSYQVRKVIDSGELVSLLTKYDPEPIPIHLTYAQQRVMPLKLRAFLEFAIPRLRASLR
jgi:DNA-binding transcriptional LysR family regulator